MEFLDGFSCVLARQFSLNFYEPMEFFGVVSPVLFSHNLTLDDRPERSGG